MLHNQILGKTGEQIAVLFFTEKGYEIVRTNWRGKFGEIDLIIRKDDEWRFIEVKMRSNIKYGYPEAAVDTRKRAHFYSAISEFLLQNKHINEDNVSADILAIVLNDREFDIRWLQDSF